MWLLPLTRSRENCTTCSTRIASFCLLLVGWLLRTRVGQPSKARGERATYGNARPGGGAGRRSSRTQPSSKASEYEGPGLRVPVEEIGSTGYTREEKQKTKAPPGGRPPHSWSTRGAEAERGLGPEPGPATRALPKRGGASTGEKKGKGKLR